MKDGNRTTRSLKPPWWRRIVRAFRKSSKPRSPLQVLVYSKKPCPLCDEAVARIEAASARHPIDLTIVDIGGEPALEAEWGMSVPVVFVDGTKRFFGHVDPVLLNRLLDASAR
jgi:glutaredoxin